MGVIFDPILDHLRQESFTKTYQMALDAILLNAEEIVFKPGVSTRGTRFETWAEVKAYVEAADHPIRIRFDDSLATPTVNSTINLGTNTMIWDTVAFAPDYQTDIVISDGVQIVGGLWVCFSDFGKIRITYSGTSAPVRSFTGGGSVAVFFSKNTILNTTGTAPIFYIGFLVVAGIFTLESSSFTTSSSQAVLQTDMIAQPVELRLLGDTSISSNTLGTGFGCDVRYSYRSVILGSISLSHFGILGFLYESYGTSADLLGYDDSYSLLGVKNVQDAIDAAAVKNHRSTATSDAYSATDYTLRYKGASGTDVIVLLDASLYPNRIVVFKNSSSVNVTLESFDGVQLIDEVSASLVVSPGSHYMLQSNDSVWWIIGS